MNSEILTCDNKDLFKTYMINYYVNNMRYSKINPDEYKDYYNKFIDDTIALYLSRNRSISFKKYINIQNRNNNIDSKINVKKIDYRDLFEKSKTDHNSKLLLINYLTNRYEFTIRYYNLGNPDIEVIVRKAKEMLTNKILNSTYDDFDKFNRSIKNYMPHIYHKLNILTNASLRNSNINLKMNKDSNKYDLNHYLNLYLKNVDNYGGILSKDDLSLYIKTLVELGLKKFLDGEKDSSFDNYLGIGMKRLRDDLKDDEKTLIKFYKLTNKRKKELFILLHYKYDYLVKSILKENNFYTPCREYFYKTKLSVCFENYVSNYPNVFMPLEKQASNYINKLIKEELKDNLVFDLELARNGDEEDKKIQKEILIEKYSYIKKSLIDEFTFYDTKENVFKYVDDTYNNIVNGYLNGISNRQAGSYIKSVSKEYILRYSNMLEKKEYLKKILEIVISKEKVFNAYLKSHNLSYEQELKLDEYLDVVTNNYIENGLYDDDHDVFFAKLLMNYDGKFFVKRGIYSGNRTISISR